MPAKDFRFGIDSSIEGLDLNQLLITHPASTYFMRLAQDQPVLNLQAGDIVQVDRSLVPKKNDIVICAEPGELELKACQFQDTLKNQQLWGVVVHLIRKLTR